MTAGDLEVRWLDAADDHVRLVELFEQIWGRAEERRVGGYLESVRIHDVCRALGKAVWCGGMLETGVGRAPNLALAALPGFTLPGDTSATARYYHRDITRAFVVEDGHVAVPTGPGIGVEPDPEVLAEVTVSSQWLRR